jgi:hypothetical protein
MITIEEFLEKTEIDFPYFIYKDTIKEWLKEYALEIASNAYDEGFTYAIHSHENFTQIGLNRTKYLQKLKNEL